MAEMYFKVSADYKALEDMRKEYERLSAEYDKARKNFDEPLKQSLLVQIADVDARMNRLAKSAAEAAAALRSAGGSFSGWRNMSSEVESVSGALREVDGALSAAGSSWKSFVGGFSAASLAVDGIRQITKAISGAFDTIKGFESANATLSAILGKDMSSMGNLMDSAKNLGRTTVFTSSQVTQLQIELSKLGFAEQDILNMSKDTLNFAMATGANLGDAASATGAVLRMFGASTEEAGRYTAAMATATTRSALNFQAIADNMATFGPMAHTLGFEIEEVLALFGKLKDAGIDGSTAMTSLRNIFNKIAQGKVEGFENLQGFDDFVHRLQDASAQFQGSGGVKKAMSSIGARGGTQFMTLMQAANDQQNGLLALRDKIKQGVEQGETDTMAERMNSTVEGELKMLSSAWEGFVLQVGESVNGPVASALHFISDTINGITDLVQGTGDGVSKEILVVVGALGTLIATYLTWKGVTQGTQMYIDSARKSFAEMDKVLERNNFLMNESVDADLRKNVSEKKMTVAQASVIQGMRDEIKERKESIQSQIDEIELRREATDQERQMAEDLLKERSEDVKDAGVELNEAKKSGDIGRIETATRKLTRATKEQAAAETAWAMVKPVDDEDEDKLEKLKEQMGELEGQEEKLNNTSTGLKGAFGALGKGIVDMGKAILTSPMFWISAVIMAVSEAVSFFTDQAKSAELAQNNLNDALSKLAEHQAEAKSRFEELDRTITDENASIHDQVQALNELKDVYDQFGGMTLGEYMGLSKEEKEAIRARNERKNAAEQTEAINELFAILSERYHNDETNFWHNADKIAKREGTRLGLPEDVIEELMKDKGRYTNLTDFFNAGYAGSIDEVVNKRKDEVLASFSDAMKAAEDGMFKGFEGLMSDIKTDIFNINRFSSDGKFDAKDSIEDLKSKIKELDTLGETLGKKQRELVVSGQKRQAEEVGKNIKAVNQAKAAVQSYLDFIEKNNGALEKLYKHREALESKRKEVVSLSNYADVNDDPEYKHLTESLEEVDAKIEEVKTKLVETADLAEINITIGAEISDEAQAQLDLWFDNVGQKAEDMSSKIEDVTKAAIENGEDAAESVKNSLSDEMAATEKYFEEQISEARANIKKLEERIEKFKNDKSKSQLVTSWKLEKDKAEADLSKMEQMIEEVRYRYSQPMESFFDFNIRLHWESLSKEDLEYWKEWMKMRGHKDWDPMRPQPNGQNTITQWDWGANNKYDLSNGGAFTSPTGTGKGTGNSAVMGFQRRSAKSITPTESTDPEEESEAEREKREKEERERKRKEEAERRKAEAEKRRAEAQRKREEAQRKREEAQRKREEARQKKDRESELRHAKEEAEYRQQEAEAEREKAAAEKLLAQSNKKLKLEAEFGGGESDWVQRQGLIYDQELTRLKYEGEREREINKLIEEDRRKFNHDEKNKTKAFSYDYDDYARRFDQTNQAVKMRYQQQIELNKIGKELRKHDLDRNSSYLDYQSRYGNKEERVSALESLSDKRLEDIMRFGDYLNEYRERMDSISDIEYDDFLDRNFMAFENAEGLLEDTLRRYVTVLQNGMDEMRGTLSPEQMEQMTGQLTSLSVELGRREAERGKDGFLRSLLPDSVRERRDRMRGLETEREIREGQRSAYDAAIAENETNRSQTIAQLAQGIFADEKFRDVYKEQTGQLFTQPDTGVLQQSDKALDELIAQYRDFGGDDKEVLKLIESLSKLRVQSDKLTGASRENDKALEQVNEEVRKTKNLTFNERLAEFSDWCGVATEALRGISGILDEFGLGDTAAAGGINDLADAGGSIMSGAADYMSGNYVGAAMNAVKAGKSILGAVDKFSGGSLFGSSKEYDDYMKKFGYVLDTWRDTIDYEKKMITETFGSLRLESAEKGQETTEHAADVARGALERWFKSGSGMFSHSKGYKLTERVEGNSQAMAEARLFGLADEAGFHRARLLTMTGEELEKLKAEAPALWMELGDTAREHLTTVIETSQEAKNIADELSQALTGMTFDSLRDNFVSTLMDMDADAETFSDNFSQYLMKAMLDNQIGEMLNKDLKEFHEKWVERSKSGGTLTEGEIKELREEYGNIVQRGLDLRDELAEVTGYEQSMSASGTTKGVQGMTQDAAEELNGRFTALQIAGEAIRGNTLLTATSLASLDQQAKLCFPTLCTIGDDIRRMQATAFLELQQINERQASWHKPLMQMASDINDMRNKINTL